MQLKKQGEGEDVPPALGPALYFSGLNSIYPDTEPDGFHNRPHPSESSRSPQTLPPPLPSSKRITTVLPSILIQYFSLSMEPFGIHVHLCLDCIAQNGIRDIALFALLCRVPPVNTPSSLTHSTDGRTWGGFQVLQRHTNSCSYPTGWTLVTWLQLVARETGK